MVNPVSSTLNVISLHLFAGSRSFLIEYWPIPHTGLDTQITTRGVDG